MFPRDALKQLGTVIVAILASTAERQLLRGRTLPSCAPNGPELVAALLKAGPKAVSVSCLAANVSCAALPAPSCPRANLSCPVLERPQRPRANLTCADITSLIRNLSEPNQIKVE